MEVCRRRRDSVGVGALAAFLNIEKSPAVGGASEGRDDRPLLAAGLFSYEVFLTGFNTLIFIVVG